ncbi:hypothetical protein QFC19_004212 [Naganishia cerealis]|uniref:Uncharacterized protein n=1 Tax=Naganishia cerealis TaxID=610337 RepID=A0ACC2VZ13_9TREE|nr:hypothetical protein QFC19_004212 [Naganishia cerealis]
MGFCLIPLRIKTDLQAFRLALTTLQSLVDDLDHLKSSYHHEVMEAEDELWNGVLEKMAFVARAKMDLHDKLGSHVDAKVTAASFVKNTGSVADPTITGARLPKGENGRNDTSTDAERSNTTANRRSFFGRLFKPSTDNLRTSGVGKPVPAPSMGRHGRHHSQQSIASTAETYTEDSEVDDAADNQGDARRRERDRRVLMGRAVPHKRDNAHNPVETKGVPRVHVHAPIPNPRRTVSGSSVDGRQGRDKRELSVIEDEDVEECGDATVDGEDIVERTPGDGAVQDLKPEVGEKTDLAGSTITTPVLEDSPISVPPSLPPDDTQDENEADSPFKPTKSETALPTSAADPDVFVAQTQPPIDDSTRGDEEDREMLTAPPSPSVDHELQTIRDSTRREGKV